MGSPANLPLGTRARAWKGSDKFVKDLLYNGFNLCLTKIISKARITPVFRKVASLRRRVFLSIATQKDYLMSDENLAPEEEVLALSEEGVETIQAESVNMNQSGANSIFAEDLSMRQSGAVGVKARTVSMRESAVVALKADEVKMVESGAISLKAENVRIEGESVAGVVLANNVDLQEGVVLAVASQNLRATRIKTKILLAGSVEGEVHTVVDTREAILIALLGGIVSGIILLMGRFLLGRKK